ncbi:MAG: signal peptidase I [Chloroflexi bacterium]|nr:signal peptidase I [Chloroflexota bacterium]
MQQSGGGAAAGGFMSIIWLAIVVVVIAGLWKVFTKAGQPGWAAIIPIYNTLVWLRIIDRPWWWLLLMFVPFVNFVILIIMCNDLSKAYGHGVGFTLGLIFLSFIFIPILGFGPSQYIGRLGAGGQSVAVPA